MSAKRVHVKSQSHYSTHPAVNYSALMESINPAMLCKIVSKLEFLYLVLINQRQKKSCRKLTLMPYLKMTTINKKVFKYSAKQNTNNFNP
jgi:hypothetical protein